MAAVLTLCVCVLLLPAVSGLQFRDRECAFTDHRQGAAPQGGPFGERRVENRTIRCSGTSRCYGLWEKRAGGEMHLVEQGCWTHVGSEQECHGDRCLVTAMPSQIQNSSYRFCCCSRDLCNANFTEAPPTAGTPALRVMQSDRRDDRQTDHQPLREGEKMLIAIVTVAIASVLIMGLFLGHRMMKGKQKHTLSAAEVMEVSHTDSAVTLDSLTLRELIGRDPGHLNECRVVYVSFVNEGSYDCVPLLQQHESICRILSAEERTGTDGRPEFLLFMEYYPHGCLSRYLSVHTLDRLTCCRMSHGVTRGLSFLHTELCRGDQYKPAMAHTDVTSRNVLVRDDLSCVLADFGLSMKLTGDGACCPEDDDSMVIVLVGRDKHRPVFPNAWKVISLVSRLLKETMEDCWDQDAEARLTAQCAEERLTELTLLRTQTATHTHRTVPPGQWAPQVEDQQVGVVRNLQADTHNRNSINSEQIQSQVHTSASRSGGLPTTTLTPPTTTSAREHKHTVGTLSTGPACLHLTEEDPEATKLDPKEADKNLRKNSNEHLLEQSQKLVTSQHQEHNHVSPSQRDQGDTPLSFTVPSLCKQQNFPQRPRSLHLLPKSKETTSESSQLKLGKLSSNHRQVETGVAKMNTVAVAMAAKPHVVSTVTNRNSTRDSAAPESQVHSVTVVPSSYSAAGPTLMTKALTERGRTNPAGPQLEEEDQVEGVAIREHHSLFNISPDEQEPLLRSEHLPAESKPVTLLHHQTRARNVLSGHDSNTNNNNNTSTSTGSALGSEVMTGVLEDEPDWLNSVEIVQDRGIRQSHYVGPALLLMPDIKYVPSGPVGPVTSGDTSTPVAEDRGQVSDTGPGLQKVSHNLKADSCLSSARAGLLDTGIPPAVRAPEAPDGHLETSSLHVPASKRPTPQTSVLESQHSELTALVETSALDSTAGSSSVGGPERPCSLELSLSRSSLDDVSLSSNGSLSASGEKIKRRVKTPYSLKKWPPASTLVSSDTALDPDFESNSSFSSQTLVSSGLHRAGGLSNPNMNQSKSSMAVFLVAGGTRATTTSKHDGMTYF